MKELAHKDTVYTRDVYTSTIYECEFQCYLANDDNTMSILVKYEGLHRILTSNSIATELEYTGMRRISEIQDKIDELQQEMHTINRNIKA